MTTQTLTLVMLYLNRLHLDTMNRRAMREVTVIKGATVNYKNRLN